MYNNGVYWFIMYNNGVFTIFKYNKHLVLSNYLKSSTTYNISC